MVLSALFDAHNWIVKGSLTPNEWGSCLAHSASPTTFDFIPRIFRKALQATNSPLFNLRAGLQCMVLLNEFPEELSSAAQDMLLLYKHVIAIIPEAVWLGYDIYKRYINISEVGDAFRAATATALSAGDINLALEWFEQGRTVLLSQTSNLKAPLDILQEAHPGLAVNIMNYATALERAGHGLHFASTNNADNKTPLQQEADKLLHLVTEYRKLLDDVRRLPGFRTFLQPKTLKELAPAAIDGPVVCINLCGSRSDALILCQSALTGPIIEHVPLPELNPYRAKKLCEQLKKFIVPQNPRLRIPPVDDVERNKNLLDFQKFLWGFIVEPLLDRIHSMNEIYSTDIPHVTWCTTGALTFLPFHAAAMNTSSAYDIVVSSYTPNLTTILPVPEKTHITQDPRVLIVASGNEEHLLPGAEQEALKAAGHFPHSSTLLVNENATNDTVLNATQRHPWIHFAVHGERDPTLTPMAKERSTVCPYHPTINIYDDHTGFASMRNAFILHNGKLPLKDLLAFSAPNAEFAFLSACDTVYSNTELPYEAVHLAAGMLSVGYRSVVATMGMIDDDDGPLIADAFYRALLKDSEQRELKLSFRTRVACALNSAVQKLREDPRYSGEEIGRLIPFVHFG